MPAEATVSVRRLRYSSFKSFPALFRDYCADFSKLREFYSGDFRDPAARRSAVSRTLSVDRDRDTLADVLLEQNERWGMSERTRSNIETLRRSESAAVVTGQQVGLFTGPMFTLLKAITTVQLAEQFSEETDQPVVPVFWMGVEDHDFDEIAGVHLLRRNEPFELRYRDAPDGNPGPVGRIELSDEITRLVDEVDELLPPTDFKDDLMRIVREAYEPGRTFGDAFAVLMSSLLSETGLILLSSDDVRLKRLAAPLFEREISDPESVARGIQRTSDRLAQRYHAQVRVEPTNLFYLSDDGRWPIDFDGETFRLRDRDRIFDRDELLQMIGENPERFSPNVVLRPLMQDTLLPTAAYVGGPGEISYFAQYRTAYEWAQLPMPLIHPRASVSLVESKVLKVLEKYDLGIADLEEDLDRLFQRVVVDAMTVDLDELFGNANRHLHEAVNGVKSGLEEVDRTLTKAAEATRSALMAEFEKLKGKAVRVEKKNHDVVRSQLGKAQVNLFPNGALQERTLSFLYFLNKYDFGLLDELRTALSIDTAEHQAIQLNS